MICNCSHNLRRSLLCRASACAWRHHQCVEHAMTSIDREQKKRWLSSRDAVLTPIEREQAVPRRTKEHAIDADANQNPRLALLKKAKRWSIDSGVGFSEAGTRKQTPDKTQQVPSSPNRHSFRILPSIFQNIHGGTR